MAADSCPENIGHFKSKLDIENYLRASTVPYSIIRPAAFFENFDDPKNYNGLKKGSIKGLWNGKVKVNMVSCADIGKAAAVVLQNPSSWLYRTLDCVSCTVTGTEFAAALTNVSGVHCKYSTLFIGYVLWFLIPDLYRMVRYFEANDNARSNMTASIDRLKRLIPEAQGPREWLIEKGQWANGTKFNR